MLYPLLENIRKQIQALSVDTDLAGFAAQVKRANPGLADAFGAISKLSLELICRIPNLMTELQRRLDRSDTAPAMRTTILAALAYLATPKDIIPDDAPAGYGYLDDCVLLTATLREVEKREGVADARLSAHMLAMNMMLMCVSPPTRKTLVEAMNGVGTMFQLLDQLPDLVLQFTDKAIIANPLAACSSAQQLPAFSPTPTYRSPADNYCPVRESLIGLAASNGFDASFLCR